MSDEVRATERPATFREVFASREYTATFAAFGLSWFGDYLAKAAVTALVYYRTDSVALSAATFAISYLPWLVGGPLLATLADRYPYRRVMVVCDLLRMVAVALVAVPGMPVEALLALLFLTSLASPPSEGARSALMPLMLTGDRLVVGMALNSTSGQVAQVTGYIAGSAMAPFVPELALLIDAATFGISALLIRFGVRHRPAAKPTAERKHLLRETGDGFALVFGTPVLRVIAMIVFAVLLFAIVPEGLAAAWAADVSGSDTEQGMGQALIMAANPVGFILGGLLVSRLVSPPRRQSLVRPFAIAAPLSLAPALLDPSAIWVALMAMVCGFAVAGMMPTANGLFVQALPHGYRARAFGVMQSGVQLMQGLAVLITGLLADIYYLPHVVGVWSIAGVALMLCVSALWPSPHRFALAIAEANRGTQAPDGPPARPERVPSSGRPIPSGPDAPPEPAAPPAQPLAGPTVGIAPMIEPQAVIAPGPTAGAGAAAEPGVGAGHAAGAGPAAEPGVEAGHAAGAGPTAEPGAGPTAGAGPAAAARAGAGHAAGAGPAAEAGAGPTAGAGPAAAARAGAGHAAGAGPAAEAGAGLAAGEPRPKGPQAPTDAAPGAGPDGASGRSGHPPQFGGSGLAVSGPEAGTGPYGRPGQDGASGHGMRPGRHNTSGAHRSPGIRSPGYLAREEMITSTGRNAGPHNCDDLPVRPTSPASEAPS